MHHLKVPQNPQAGDTIYSLLLGYESRHPMIFQPCPVCGEKRWVCNVESERIRVCKSCHVKSTRNIPRPYRQVKTITINDSPKEGDIIRGRDINKKGGLYQWVLCVECKKGRWVYKGAVLQYPRCVECGEEYRKRTYIGELSSNWKGGRITQRKGYIEVIMREDNPYYRMANHIGYVPEHRLVMAQYLGRCIEKWEIVHHKNRRKSDNRIENLELIESKNAHNIITVMQKEIKKLQGNISQLEKKGKLSEWIIKELQSKLLELDKERRVA